MQEQISSINIFKWLIVFGSFIIYFIADGVSLSFGILTRELIDYFNKNEQESSVFITTGLIQAVPLFLSPLVCVLIEKIKCRKVALIGSILISLSFILTRFFVNSLVTLNIIIGLMLSCGLAMCYIPAYLIISFHFNKRRALATGIAVSGSGLGVFILSPLLEILIKEYGWMDSCLIFGAISSHTFISACLFRPARSVKSVENLKPVDSMVTNEKAQEKSSFNFYFFISDIQTIYSNKKFILVNFAYFILSFVIVVPYNFLPSHVKLNNIHDPSSISISLLGISAVVGQVFIGFISDKYRSKNWLIFSICIIISGLITCFLPILNNVYFIYIYSILFGFFTSVNYVLQSSLVIESLGLANLTLAFGCLQLSQGFSTLFGTPILSWLKDYTNDYNMTFYVSGCLMLFSGLVLLTWPFWKRNQQHIAVSLDLI